MPVGLRKHEGTRVRLCTHLCVHTCDPRCLGTLHDDSQSCAHLCVGTCDPWCLERMVGLFQELPSAGNILSDLSINPA